MDENPFSKDITSPEYTLKYIIDLNLVEIREDLEDIKVTAIKEAELLKMIENVEKFWIDASLTVIPYKEKDNIFILGNNEEIISKIDDIKLTLNNILGSRYVERIRDRVNKEMKKFRYLSELLDEWILH